jgi:AhpD family alkylhydroperoxidase
MKGKRIMVEDPKKYLDNLNSAMGRFAKVDKDTLKAFGNLNENTLKAGALDRKTKTLMCVAIGIATHCDYCIAARTAQAVQAGATRKELLETAAVGLLMGGSLAMGPILTIFMDTVNMLAPESPGE